MCTCYSWFKQGGSFGLGPEILEEIGRDTNQVGSNLELTIMNLFQPFPFRNGKRKVPDDVAKLTEKIHDLKMRMRVRDEEIQRLEVNPSLRANEL
ncbi:hypothetical protein Goari_004718 [Gossypium aridum]|uniref:Uncharacterized protein n=1 Tax=Gossypium aridum TaxID=34290 RepID=A0A7J8Y4A6_GOSAI|nr:hypothetical protein [Gossypium aridum]